MSAWPQLSEFLWAHRDAPTLSVYLEAAPADPAAGRAASLRLRQAIQETREAAASHPPAEREALEACIDDLIEVIPTAEHRSRRAGWAYFRTATGDRLVVATPPAVETAVAWGIGPRVVPFLRAAEPESALLVQIDRAEARISLLHDDVIDRVVTLEADPVTDVGPHMSAGPSPGFHRGTGGRAGADEAQRQRRDAGDRLLITALRRVVLLAEDALPVVIGGSDVVTSRMQSWMPSKLAARSVILPALQMQDAVQLLPEIQDALRALRAREQAQHLSELRDAAAAHGRAAIGIEKIRAAAEVGAIAELIFSDTAWRLHPEEIEGIVHRALTTGARVEWTPLDPPEPAKKDGIIAKLRFPL